MPSATVTFCVIVLHIPSQRSSYIWQRSTKKHQYFFSFDLCSKDQFGKLSRSCLSCFGLLINYPIILPSPLEWSMPFSWYSLVDQGDCKMQLFLGISFKEFLEKIWLYQCGIVLHKMNSVPIMNHQMIKQLKPAHWKHSKLSASSCLLSIVT